MSEYTPKENDCRTCIYLEDHEDDAPCCICSNAGEWHPSHVYTAYLHEKAKAERYRQALNCNCNNGKIMTDDIYDCPDCADVRKEVRL